MALFTLAEFKTSEGIASAVHDTLITRLATAATEALQQFCKRKFESASYSSDLDGTGRESIVIPNPPISGITLTVTTNRDFAGTTATPATDYVVDGDAGVITLLPSVELTIPKSAPIFPAGIRNVRVAYTGGFSTLPEDLKQAGIMLASSWMVRRRAGGVQSMTLGGATISFQTRDIPAEVRAIASRYRVMPVGLVT